MMPYRKKESSMESFKISIKYRIKNSKNIYNRVSFYLYLDHPSDNFKFDKTL